MANSRGTVCRTWSKQTNVLTFHWQKYRLRRRVVKTGHLACNLATPTVLLQGINKMASRSGQRAGGTDGTDYTYREKVATPYQRSVYLKKSIKTVMMIQVLCAIYTLVIVIIAGDLPSLLVVIGYSIGLPSCWQSLQRNNVHLINIYGVCCSLLGIFPMAYILYSFLWTHGITSHHWLRFIEAVVVIATNGVASYFAKELMTLWSSSSSKRPKTKH